MIVYCSLCLMEFNKTDPDYNNRIIRHNDFHSLEESKNETRHKEIQNIISKYN